MKVHMLILSKNFKSDRLLAPAKNSPTSALALPADVLIGSRRHASMGKRTPSSRGKNRQGVR